MEDAANSTKDWDLGTDDAANRAHRAHQGLGSSDGRPRKQSTPMIHLNR